MNVERGTCEWQSQREGFAEAPSCSDDVCKTSEVTRERRAFDGESGQASDAFSARRNRGACGQVGRRRSVSDGPEGREANGKKGFTSS